MQEKIDMLLLSYSLSDLLEDNDVSEEYVLLWLLENELINLEDYFNQEGELG